MKMSIWTTVARLHEAKMSVADWRRLLAADFKRVQPYLVECAGEIAGTIPCPHSGQRLQVAECGRKYAAFPEEGFEGDSYPLTDLKLADVILWRLDRGSLEAGLCGVLDLSPVASHEYTSDSARLIGTVGAGEARKLFFLGYAVDESAALILCVGVAQANRQRCCLVLPVFFPRCDEYLRRCEHDMIVLEDVAAFADNGLVAREKPEGRRLKAVGERVSSEQSAVSSGAVSGRLREKRVEAGRRRSVVYDKNDRRAVRAEVRRVIALGLSQTEACRQVAEQAQKGRAGAHALTIKYDLPAVSWAVVRRVYMANW